MADNSIRTNTPDPTKYHPNTGGMPGTMIPRAGNDGQSLGFDPNRPRTVIVDPGEVGGGFTLDLSAINRVKTNFNAAAKRQEVMSDVSAFYREISQRLAEPPVPEPPALKEKPMAEPLKPLDSLPTVPSHADTADTTTADEIAWLLQQEHENARIQQQKFRTEAPRVPAPANSDELQLRLQLAQQTNMINAMVARINLLTPPEPKAELPPAPVVDPATQIAAAFESLQIPFMTGERSERPQFETYFEMPRMGTMAARYHAVVVGQDCLALVYDTRFADGFQYLPPNLGEELITVSVPKLKATYSCSSLGLHWSIGCLDIVILICHKGDV